VTTLPALLLRRLRHLSWAAVLSCASVAWAISSNEPIQPVPLAHGQDPARVALGRRLFQDTRLSGNGLTSCATCHSGRHAGTDGRERPVATRGSGSPFNTPTVLNAALNFRQFWDGRAGSLEAQVDAVLQNPHEMASRWEDVVAKLAADAGYRAAFSATYQDGVTRANVVNALASYERALITPGGRFDQYLRGRADALTPQEKAGYARFKQYGCVSCHQGVNVGGNMYQKFGVMGEPPSATDTGRAGQGRSAVTGNPADRHVFKVPSLRNVAQTGPYFHDGSARTLDEAVDAMFRYQLGRTASAADKAAIVKFLHTLSAPPLEPLP
jgi:cytochrome c peroxidase